MRFSTMALTAGVVLAAAGTTFAAPGRARSAEVQLCHEYVRANHAGNGSLHAGTTFSALVESAGCEGKNGADCVLKYCYGEAAAETPRGEAFTLDR